MHNMCLLWIFLAHAYLLDVSSSLFLSCALNNLKKSSKPWGAIDEENLGYFAINFLNHSVKLLSIYVHVIDGREPELREKVNVHDIRVDHVLFFSEMGVKSCLGFDLCNELIYFDL